MTSPLPQSAFTLRAATAPGVSTAAGDEFDAGSLFVDVAFPFLIFVALVLLAVWYYRGRDKEDHPSREIDEYCRSYPLAAFMVTCSVALSIASFWTTYGGMEQLIGNVVITFLISLGIQGSMLVFALKLSSDLFEQKGGSNFFAVLFSAAAYASAAFLSSGFSTAKMFDIVFVGEERRQWAQATTTEAISGALNDLGNRIEQDAAAHARSLNDGAWRAMETNISQASAVLEDLRVQLGREAEAERAARVERITSRQDLQNQLATLESERSEQQRIFESATTELERIDGALSEWRTQYGELDAQIRRLDRQIEDEMAGELGGRPAGCGPVCETLQEQRRELADPFESGPMQERALLTSDREAAATRLEGSRTRLTELETQIGRLEAQAESGNIPAEPADQAEASQNASSSDELLAVLNQATGPAGLSTLVVNFRNDPSRSRFEAIQRICAAVETQTLQRGQTGVGCNLNEVQSEAQRAILLAEGRAYYQQNCILGEGDMSSMGTGAMAARALECINQSALDRARVADIRDEVLLIQRTRSENAHPFSLIITALRDRERLAWLSLIIAFLIDGLILLTSLLSVLVKIDPVQTAAGLTRHEIGAVRSALNAAPGISQQRAARFMLKLLGGPAPMERDYGFTVVRVSAVDQDYIPFIESILSAATGAQVKGAASEPARLLGLVVAWIGVSVIAWIALGSIWWALCAGVVTGIGTLILKAQLARRRKPAETGEEAPRLVWRERPDPAAPEKQRIVAISPRFLKALHAIALEEETASPTAMPGSDDLKGNFASA